MSNADNVKEFYSNDIVYRFDKHKRIILGVVVDSYEASSEVDDYHALQKGQIRVLWNNSSTDQAWRQSKVRLLNRNVIPGDVVRRLEKGKETQRGYCKDSKETVTLQIVGTDKVIEHVSSDRLKNVKPYNIDDAVCLGDKFGRIEAIEEIVTMQSSCGSIVEVLTSINHDLDDYWLYKKNKVSFEIHYPGQEVICTPSSLNQPNWIKKSKAMKKAMHIKRRFTVQNVQDELIEVAWCNITSGYSHLAEITQSEIKQLKVMEFLCDLELSERRLLKLGSNDVLQKKKDWVRKLSLTYRPEVPKVRHIVNSKNKSRVPLIRSKSLLYSCAEEPVEAEEDWWTEDGEEFEDCDVTSQNTSLSKTRKRHYPPKPRELAPGHTLPVEVICIESKITVVWQDGSEEVDVPSSQLYYSISLDDHEFFPGECVVPDAKDEGGSDYGVVQHVNCLERTALIKWFTYSETEKKPQETSTKEMSVYDIKKHPKFCFRPGSVVKCKPVQENKMGRVIDSCVQGYVVVRWLGNVEENCWPQDIEVVVDNCDYDVSDEESSEDEAQVSWETESIESYAGDNSDEISLQNMAARLDFVRSRIVYLKDAFKNHAVTENLSFLKDLLMVYDNSSYLDKLLGTSFFSLKSRHFQALLLVAKDKARKFLGVELRGRLFLDNLCPSVTKIKVAEKDNINKIIKLENKVNAQIEKKEGGKESIEPTTPDSATDLASITQENVCVELLSMIKIRMDLAYAEIISRIGGPQALTVITKASEYALTHSNSTPLPSYPTTPEESFSTSSPLKQLAQTESNTSTSCSVLDSDAYSIVDEALGSHHYFASKFQPTDQQRFLKAVQKEYKLLKESLPPGVWVRSYGNRIDLLSVMIRGPAKTPYEDGLFLFDIQLSPDYPRSPPLVHYITYSTERLNPNLYVEGKVCVSLLGTWMGRGTEVWGPTSTLLQLIVSIQGLILVSEPYYNEAGYEKQTDTQQGYENSRTYNELVILKLVQSMSEMLLSPPEVFKEEVLAHFSQHGNEICARLRKFCGDSDPLGADFPLVPVSKGLKLSLSASLDAFASVLQKVLQHDAE